MCSYFHLERSETFSTFCRTRSQLFSVRPLISLFCLLLSVVAMQAEQMVLTVSAYNAVSADGDVPEDAVIDYFQYQSTHYKERLCAGDTAVLTIDDMPAGRIEKVTLSMKSNSQGGAGYLQMAAGGRQVWEIEENGFNDVAWNGSYSTNYVDIEKTFDEVVSTDEIRLTIVATQNSLYIHSFTIDYVLASGSVYTVSFDTHSAERCRPRHESEVGGGVILPQIGDPGAGWFFLGWTERPQTLLSVCPPYRSVGDRYYPQSDITLHALYTTDSIRMDGIPQQTNFVSGEYALVSESKSVMINEGMLNSKNSYRLPLESCSLINGGSRWFLDVTTIPSSCRYFISFESDSLTIQHVETDLSIGYNKAQSRLENNNQKWAWHELEDHSLFIHYGYVEDENGVGRGYAFTVYPNDSGVYQARLRYVKSATAASLMLFPVMEIGQDNIFYSSTPAMSETKELQVMFINWDEPVSVYYIDGSLLTSGVLRKDMLPQGVWIVRQGKAIQKIIK